MAAKGKSPLKLILQLLVVALVAAGAYYYYARNKAATGLPEYTTTTVALGDITQAITATGQLDAVLSVDVGSQISGLIQKLYVDFNSTVKKGDPLLDIDPATYEQRVRQAEANLASTEAGNKLQRLNTERTKELRAKNLVSQQEYDQAVAQLQQSEAQLLTSKATVENARVDLERCKITSPIDGIVISKQTEEGKTVAASLNAPVLFTIANDLAKMQITAAVSEADIGTVQAGQTVNFTADAFPNRSFKGIVTQVRNAPKTVSNVVSYDTIIAVDNRDLKLRPGMTANVSIVVAKREKVIRVPNATLRVRMPEGLAAQPKSAAPTSPEAKKSDAPAAKSEVASAPTNSGGNRQGGGNAGGGGAGGGQRRGGFLPADATPEQREKLREVLAEVGYTPGAGGPPSQEQRDQIRKLLVERGVISADAAENTVVIRTVYRLPGGNKLAQPEAVSVRVGVTDGLASEILSGLAEGDVLVTSVTVPNASKSAAPAANPFSGGGQRRF
ncbi:efflux RND transporter periplasmic adaptor subunit [Oleiharenicola lentus]|uniref:efflux RND transporter periplasmic adaptor subunit n=1 Tax=Oleiharenicola lentus TaxID=2508720 RepID=UPI003F663A4B